MTLTQKESSLIKDLKSQEKLCIDKYTKGANEACDGGRVSVNGKIARASLEVKIGDIIEVAMGSRPIKVKVTALNESPTKESASSNFIVVE